MTIEQLFAWCFEQNVLLHFETIHTASGQRKEVKVYQASPHGDMEEVIGSGKNVMAAIQDAIQQMRKQEVSA